MFPWDEDQTWGVAMMMGGGEGEVFHTMAITFGMNGDRPPGQAAGAEPNGFFNFGGGKARKGVRDNCGTAAGVPHER
jgi:hypothetical protein